MRAALLLLHCSLSLSLGAACLRQTEYHCTSNEQCGAGGTCQVVGSIGYCAFADSECGQRFGDSAGPYANQCVGEQGRDAGIDTPPAATCPAEYTALPNDAANPHRYRLAPQNLNWDSQRMFCSQTSPKAYLAFPDTLAELTGLYMLAGNTTFWVGIDDRTTEGMFVLASGGPAPANLPWASGEPDNAGGGGGQDCVAAGATTLSDEACTGGNANRPAVCECVP